MPDDTIIIKAPAGTKARWVRQSQREGAKLSDWVVKHMEASIMAQQITRLSVPVGVDFADLRLARDASGTVSFAWEPLEQICRASGIGIDVVRASSDNAAALIAAWYAAHRQNGGAADQVQEQLIAEVMAEDAHGSGLSHKPGRA